MSSIALNSDQVFTTDPSAATTATIEWQMAPASMGAEEWLENMPVPNAPKLESTPTFSEPDWALPSLFYPPIPSTRSASREAPQAPASANADEWLENMPVPNAPKLESTPTFSEPDWALPPLFYPPIPSTRSASREAPQAPASANPDESFEYIPTPNAPRLAATPTFSGLEPDFPAFDPLPPHYPTPSPPLHQLVTPPTTRPAYTHPIENSIRSPYPSSDSAVAISSSIRSVRPARQTKAQTNLRAFTQAGFMIVSADEAVRPVGQRRAVKKAVAIARKAAAKLVQRTAQKLVQAPSTVASSTSVPRRSLPKQTDSRPRAANPAGLAPTWPMVNSGSDTSATVQQQFAELFSFPFPAEDPTWVAAFDVPPVARSDHVVGQEVLLAPFPGCAITLQQPLGRWMAVSSC